MPRTLNDYAQIAKSNFLDKPPYEVVKQLFADVSASHNKLASLIVHFEFQCR